MREGQTSPESKILELNGKMLLDKELLNEWC